MTFAKFHIILGLAVLFPALLNAEEDTKKSYLNVLIRSKQVQELLEVTDQQIDDLREVAKEANQRLRDAKQQVVEKIKAKVKKDLDAGISGEKLRKYAEKEHPEQMARVEAENLDWICEQIDEILLNHQRRELDRAIWRSFAFGAFGCREFNEELEITEKQKQQIIAASHEYAQLYQHYRVIFYPPPPDFEDHLSQWKPEMPPAEKAAMDKLVKTIHAARVFAILNEKQQHRIKQLLNEQDLMFDEAEKLQQQPSWIERWKEEKAEQDLLNSESNRG